tara:strand:- start:1190 stop:1789 length:600 start_codon:yes stop_codon:yes gene_type:complete
MRALYIRVSTKEQKLDRQLIDKEDYDKLYTDKVSGTVKLRDREAGSDLIADAMSGEITSIEVADIDRLGRDLMDILENVRLFQSLGIMVKAGKLGDSLDANGEINPIFEMLVGILGSVAQMERDKILERTAQGRAISMMRHPEKWTGRKEGTTISRDKLIEKYKTELKIIRKHPELSLAKLKVLTGRSHQLITKLKKLI